MTLQDWISAQVDKHAIAASSTESVARSDQTNAVRLIDAAAALRSGQGQAFGLEIPPEGIPGSGTLVSLCLHAAEQWGPALDAESRADLGRMLQRLALPAIFAIPTSPERVGTLELLLAAEAEEDDEDQELNEDAAVAPLQGAALASLNNVEAAQGSVLADLPCIADVAGEWLLETGVRLVFDEATSKLRCELAFEVSNEPTAAQVLELVHAIENELFDTSWALNLQWMLPEGVFCIVHLRSKVLSSRFERVGVG